MPATEGVRSRPGHVQQGGDGRCGFAEGLELKELIAAGSGVLEGRRLVFKALRIN